MSVRNCLNGITLPRMTAGLPSYNSRLIRVNDGGMDPTFKMFVTNFPDMPTEVIRAFRLRNISLVINGKTTLTVEQLAEKLMTELNNNGQNWMSMFKFDDFPEVIDLHFWYIVTMVGIYDEFLAITKDPVMAHRSAKLYEDEVRAFTSEFIIKQSLRNDAWIKIPLTAIDHIVQSIINKGSCQTCQIVQIPIEHSNIN